jgi:hypothetical protein
VVLLAPLADVPGTFPPLELVDLKRATAPVDRIRTAAADGAGCRRTGDGRDRIETAEPGRPVVVTTAGGEQ